MTEEQKHFDEEPVSVVCNYWKNRWHEERSSEHNIYYSYNLRFASLTEEERAACATPCYECKTCDILILEKRKKRMRKEKKSKGISE